MSDSKRHSTLDDLFVDDFTLIRESLPQHHVSMEQDYAPGHPALDALQRIEEQVEALQEIAQEVACMRTAAEIKATGAAWVTESEVTWLCEQFEAAKQWSDDSISRASQRIDKVENERDRQYWIGYKHALVDAAIMASFPAKRPSE